MHSILFYLYFLFRCILYEYRFFGLFNIFKGFNVYLEIYVKIEIFFSFLDPNNYLLETYFKGICFI